MTQSMDANTFALYIHELRNQCMYTEAALGLFNQSMEKQAKTGVFFAAQCFLTSASQVVRLLWPIRAKAKRRGEFLRRALNLPDDFPLADDRLRNLWDLADEKTDDWIQGSKNQMIAYDFLGPKESLGEKTPKDEHIYRLYDPSKSHFYFRGEVFNLQAIASGIAAINARVNQVHDQLFPKKQAEGDAPAPQAKAEQPSAPTPTEAAAPSA